MDSSRTPCASDIGSEVCEYSQGTQLTSHKTDDSSKHCECMGCKDYSILNEPVEVAMSEVLHSCHSKKAMKILLHKIQ